MYYRYVFPPYIYIHESDDLNPMEPLFSNMLISNMSRIF